MSNSYLRPRFDLPGLSIHAIIDSQEGTNANSNPQQESDVFSYKNVCLWTKDRRKYFHCYRRLQWHMTVSASTRAKAVSHKTCPHVDTPVYQGMMFNVKNDVMIVGYFDRLTFWWFRPQECGSFVHLVLWSSSGKGSHCFVLFHRTDCPSELLLQPATLAR